MQSECFFFLDLVGIPSTGNKGWCAFYKVYVFDTEKNTWKSCGEGLTLYKK